MEPSQSTLVVCKMAEEKVELKRALNGLIVAVEKLDIAGREEYSIAVALANAKEALVRTN